MLLRSSSNSLGGVAFSGVGDPESSLQCPVQLFAGTFTTLICVTRDELTWAGHHMKWRKHISEERYARRLQGAPCPRPDKVKFLSEAPRYLISDHILLASTYFNVYNAEAIPLRTISLLSATKEFLFLGAIVSREQSNGVGLRVICSALIFWCTASYRASKKTASGQGSIAVGLDHFNLYISKSVLEDHLPGLSWYSIEERNPK